MYGTLFNRNVKLTSHNNVSFENSRTKKDAYAAAALNIDFKKNDLLSLKGFLEELSLIPEDSKIRYVIAWDTETTGLTGYACSFAGILYDLKEKKVLDKKYFLINPQTSISFEATNIHKITDEDVKNEPTFEHFVNEIIEMFLKADMSTGHNLTFDMKVFDREFERLEKVNPIAGMPFFDTMKFGRQYMGFTDKAGKVKDPKLEEAMSYYGLSSDGEYHNALVDTEATLNVFIKMMELGTNKESAGINLNPLSIYKDPDYYKNLLNVKTEEEIISEHLEAIYEFEGAIFKKPVQQEIEWVSTEEAKKLDPQDIDDLPQPKEPDNEWTCPF